MTVETSRSPLDRPLGLAPKGTSWGVGLGLTYAAFAPMLAVMCLSPWLPGGVVTGLSIAMPLGLVWMFAAIPVIIGFKSRRHWGVVAFFSICTFSAIAVPAALVIVAGVLLATLGRWPAQVFLVWFYAPWLLVMTLFWPLLVRTLRLKYWQPWTTPDQWETTQERAASWVYKAAGAKSPTRDSAHR